MLQKKAKEEKEAEEKPVRTEGRGYPEPAYGAPPPAYGAAPPPGGYGAPPGPQGGYGPPPPGAYGGYGGCPGPYGVHADHDLPGQPHAAVIALCFLHDLTHASSCAGCMHVTLFAPVRPLSLHGVMITLVLVQGLPRRRITEADRRLRTTEGRRRRSRATGSPGGITVAATASPSPGRATARPWANGASPLQVCGWRMRYLLCRPALAEHPSLLGQLRT